MAFRVIESDSIISCTAACLSAIHLGRKEGGDGRKEKRCELQGRAEKQGVKAITTSSLCKKQKLYATEMLAAD